jgi:hypothetical protein
VASLLSLSGASLSMQCKSEFTRDRVYSFTILIVSVLIIWSLE